MMFPICTPRKFIDHSVILMQIVAVVSQNKIRFCAGFQLLEECLDVLSTIREETLLETFGDDGPCMCVTKEPVGAGHCLTPSFSSCAKHHPCNVAFARGLKHVKNHAAASDFNIV
jgi:hypothetical protein